MSPVAGLGRIDVEPLGQAEVGDLGRAVGGEEDVGRFEVAVDHAALVGRMHGPRQRLHQRRRLTGRLRDAPQLRFQAAAGHELQGEVRAALVFAYFIDADDVGVFQAGQRFGLAAKASRLARAGDGGRSILRAVNRFMPRCRALYTTPMPPLPTSPRIS